GFHSCGACELRAGGIAHIDPDSRGQADAQRMLDQLLWIECDSDGDPLYDLDPVSRGILCRKQREGGARPQAQPLDGSAILDAAAVQIGADANRLPDAHLVEL